MQILFEDEFPLGPCGPRVKKGVIQKSEIERLKQQVIETMGDGSLADAVRLYNQAWEMESMRLFNSAIRLLDDE